MKYYTVAELTTIFPASKCKIRPILCRYDMQKYVARKKFKGHKKAALCLAENGFEALNYWLTASNRRGKNDFK